MEFTLFDGINLTVSAMLIVILALTLIMFCIQYVSQLIEKYERVQDVLRQADEKDKLASTSALMGSDRQSVTKKDLFEEDKLAKVAVLTALAHASEDEPDKRFEVVSVIKK